MKLKPIKNDTLPERYEDERFIYNDRDDYGHKLRLYTYDKETHKSCEPDFHYKRIGSELVMISEKEYNNI